MKKPIIIIIAASSLFLTGCCTTRHPTQRWEYKVTYSNPVGPGGLNLERQTAQLNDCGKEGWILVAKDQGLFYWRRPLK